MHRVQPLASAARDAPWQAMHHVFHIVYMVQVPLSPFRAIHARSVHANMCKDRGGPHVSPCGVAHGGLGMVHIVQDLFWSVWMADVGQTHPGCGRQNFDGFRSSFFIHI